MASFFTPAPTATGACGTWVSAFSPATRVPAAARRSPLTDDPLPFDPLAGVPREAQSWLWGRLLQAVEETVWDRAACPPRQPPDVSPPVSRLGQPAFRPEMLRGIALAGLRRMLRLEVRLALEALEAWLLAPQEGVARGAARRFLLLMAEHCDRIGQLYREMRRRLGAPLALLFLNWELRLLRYRGSVVVAPLAFGELAAL